MGKFDGILICTDLDGTLYKSDKTISQENRDAIEYFKSEGGYFTFITGRLPYYSTDAYRLVRPNAPYGCTNGGGVYDGDEDRYVWSLELDHAAFALVSRIDELFPNVGIELCALYDTYFAKESSATLIHRERTGLPYLPCEYRAFDLPLGKIMFCTECEEDLRAVEKTLRSHPLSEKFDFIRSERTLFEILPKGVDKSLSLKKIAEHLNIDISRTVAVGDYDNDVAMLRAAGLGVAVSNASPRAISAADLVTVSNDDHAIARIIYDIAEGKIVL